MPVDITAPGADGQTESHVGQRLLGEFVKSYGAKYDETTNEWNWSAANIGEAFRESPIWTTLDYATFALPVGKLGLAARAVAKGKGAAGMAYLAAKEGAEVAALSRKPARGLAKLAGAFAEKPREFARAVELEMRAPSRNRVGRFFESPVAGLRRGADDDYLELIRGGYSHEADRRMYVSMLERETKAAQQQRMVDAADVAGSLKGLDPKAGAGVTRALEMGGLRPGREIAQTASSERGRRMQASLARQDEIAQRRLGRVLGDDPKAAAAYAKTFEFREKLHRDLYDLKMISRDQYARNLGKYAPHLYEEFLGAEKAAGTSGLAGGTLDSLKARTLPRQADKLSRRASKLRNRAEELRQKGGEANLARAGQLDAQAEKLLTRKAGVGAELTRVLDPKATAGRLLQTAQAVTKQRWAQKLANSVVAQDPWTVLERAAGAGSQNAQALMQLRGAGRRVAKEAIDDVLVGELGWRRLQDFFPGRELPGYLERLRPTGILDRYLDPAAAEGIAATFKFAEKPVFDEFFSKARKSLAFFRSSKTVMNPATHFRNVMSGIVFNSFTTGTPKLAPVKGYKALRARGRDFREAVEAGALGGSDHQITIELLQKAGVSIEDANPYKLKFLGDSRVGKALEKAHDGMASLYRMEDDAWKLDAFVTQRDKYLKAGMRRDQAISRATLDVAKFMPSFNQTSPFTQLIASAVPFASFTNEAIRVWKNTLIEKPHLALFWQHFGGAWTEAVGGVQGYSQDELERVKSNMPSHLQGKPSMLVPWKIDGQPHFFDLSYIIPLAGNMGAVGNEANQNFFTSEFYDISGNPAVGLGIILATGQDPFTGKPVEPRFAERQMGANIENPTARKYVGLGEWMAATMLPPLAPVGYSGQNLLELARGQKNPNTGLAEEPDVSRTIAANLFGLRTYEATLSSAILNQRIAEDQIQKRIETQWKIHSRATANGDHTGQVEALDNLRHLKSRLEADPSKVEEYLADGIKAREPGKFRTLSSKLAAKVLSQTEGIELSPEQLQLRGQLMSRVQERTSRKRSRRARKGRSRKRGEKK